MFTQDAYDEFSNTPQISSYMISYIWSFGHALVKLLQIEPSHLLRKNLIWTLTLNQ